MAGSEKYKVLFGCLNSVATLLLVKAIGVGDVTVADGWVSVPPAQSTRQVAALPDSVLAQDIEGLCDMSCRVYPSDMVQFQAFLSGDLPLQTTGEAP